MIDTDKKEKPVFYITTAIAYTSRKPHIGNTYEAIMTDAVARYKRRQGYDVFFLTGTDEHGQKIENYAKEQGISPKEFVDDVSGQVKGIWDLMNVSYDKFIRTTDEYHEKAVSAIFKKLWEKGDIYKSEYEGWYCEPCESFLTDTQLVDGKCPDCGREVKKTREESYFFRMSAYQDRLEKYFDEHPDFIEPEARKKEMINNFLKPGLQDLCVSRSSFKWGIPVPFDNNHVIYVWIDALSNYISALGYDPYAGVQPDLFDKYWPADVQIIGKDIMRFHVIYWPIILMALDLPLPKKVFGHPWLNIGQDKMSKSRGNSIYADDLASVIGVDAVREYVLAEMPYLNDGSITYENVITRYNSDLANNLGNLVNRSIAMTEKYFDGIVPVCGEPDETDLDLIASVKSGVEKVSSYMDCYRVADACAAVFDLFRRGNKYIDETTPWILAKQGDKKRLGTVIYNLLEAIRVSASALYPFMPSTSEKILEQLGTEITDTTFGLLESGRKVGKAEVLFARLDESKTMELFESKRNPETAVPFPEDTEKEITIDDFAKTELRIAKVIDCVPVPKAKKLLKLTVDLGYEKRTVVSGIAKSYKPEELVGKKVVIVANLKPAVICGVESRGMIIASGEDDNIKVLFAADDAVPGQRIH